MFHFNIKDQNRNRIFLIMVLGGIWGIVDNFQFKGVIAFLIDGGLILLLSVTLGHLTNIILEQLGLTKDVQESLILDEKEEKISAKQKEDQKDIAALNYGIGWAIFLILFNMFLL